MRLISNVFLVLFVLPLSLTVSVTPLSDVDESDIISLRDAMLEEFKTNPDSYDPVDMDLIGDTSDSWPVRRYLEAHENVEDAFGAMKENLNFRNEARINHWTTKDFPCEFYELVPIYLTQDRQKRPVAIFRFATNGPYGSLRELWYKFILYNFELIDQLAGPKQWMIVGDLGDIGARNFDLQGIHVLFPIIDRFPAGMHMVISANAGPLLTPIVNMLLAMVPSRLSEITKSLDGKEILKYIHRKDLPVYMGGRKWRQRAMPLFKDALEICENIWKVAKQLEWSIEDVKDFMETNEEIIEKNRLSGSLLGTIR